MAVLTLQKAGRTEIDVLEQPSLFLFFLAVYRLENDKKSYATEVCKAVYDCSEIEDVTKSIEYQRVLRYASRLQDNGLLYVVKDKKSKGKKSHYKVDWNGVVNMILDFVKNAPAYIGSSGRMIDENLKKRKDNKYILAFIKLYYRGISTSDAFRFFTPITFKDSILLLVNKIMIKFKPEDLKKNRSAELVEYSLKYEKTNPELSTFFDFLHILREFEQDYRPHSALNAVRRDLWTYVKFKAENTQDIELSELDKGFSGRLLNMEDDLDAIDKFHFPD